MYLGQTAVPGPYLYLGIPPSTTATRTPATPQELRTSWRTERWAVEATSSSGLVAPVPIISASVTIESDRTPRRTASLSLPPLVEWVPDGLGRDLLDPQAGTEITVTMHLSRPGEKEVPYPLGVFGIAKVAMSRSSSSESLTVACVDRSARVAAAKLLAPITLTAGTPVENAISSVLAQRAPWLPFVPSVTNRTVPDAWLGQVGDDPWKACVQLAAQAGWLLYVDAKGIARMRRITDPLSATPAVEWASGEAGLLDAITRELDGSELIDSVIVPWQGGTVVVGVGARQARPVMMPGDKSLLVTAEHATSAGLSHLAMVRGAAETVTCTTWADPARDVDEVASIVDDPTRTDVRARITGLGLTSTSSLMSVKLANRRIGG